MATSEELSTVILPRVTIKFCTQCKWMLRAAYFAQELLSTFSTSLGEVALIPSTGGVFTVEIVHHVSPPGRSPEEAMISTQLWDRKTNGGFPEVKHLKQLVRNVIDPDRDLGHVDRHQGDKEGIETKKDAQKVAPTEMSGDRGKGEVEDIEARSTTGQSRDQQTAASAGSAGEGKMTEALTKSKQHIEDCENCD